MPYYKKSEFINASVNSILNQSFKEFEIILIDDELTKNSYEILENVKKLDVRIRVFKNKKNLGAGQSRMTINFCKGQYIAFCDCDDLWRQNKLENK